MTHLLCLSWSCACVDYPPPSSTSSQCGTTSQSPSENSCFSAMDPGMHSLYTICCDLFECLYASQDQAMVASPPLLQHFHLCSVSHLVPLFLYLCYWSLSLYLFIFWPHRPPGECYSAFKSQFMLFSCCLSMSLSSLFIISTLVGEPKTFL